MFMLLLHYRSLKIHYIDWIRPLTTQGYSAQNFWQNPCPIVLIPIYGGQQNIVIMKEREVPLNFQITVTNVTRISSRSMADYFITFSSQASSLQWKSPLIHGKVTKENTRFPWTFVADSHQMKVNFHQLDGGQEKIVGSMPLMLMKQSGEEEFLIFGCIEANRGRKVAEIDFTYNQCSVAASLPSNEESKRASLQYTIEVENYDNKKQLNMIPEEPQISAQKQTNSHIKMPDESLVDSRDFHPSRLETLKIQSNRRRFTEDSNFELNLIREMEDATDRWYRNNFGKDKPSDLENCDIEDTRVISLRYQHSYEYLNELSYTSPHMELKNLLLLTEKLPQTVQLYGIDIEGSQLLKKKVASMSVEGYRYNWPTSIRLPCEKKAYGLEVITSDKERLQGLIIKDTNSKQVLEVFNKNGQRVGRANYTLKEIRKIEIQTMEIMQRFPTADEKEVTTERQLTNYLDKSFLKENRQQSQKESTWNDYLAKSDNEYPLKEKYKLIKEIYLNRSREEHPQVQRTHERQSIHIPQSIQYPQTQRIITNNAYISMPSDSLSKGKTFRKNQYKLDPSEIHHQPQTQISPISIPTHYLSPPDSSMNEVNDFLPEASQEEIEGGLVRRPSQNLNKKIEELKKIGSDLGKKTKTFPSKRFSKNAKYKTVIYNEQKQEEQLEIRRSLQRSDSGKQSQHHKRSYREPINNTNSSLPINATPSFQSLLINNTFSNEQPLPKESEPSKAYQSNQGKKEQLPPILPEVADTSEISAAPISDDSQQVPITRHKTADQIMLKAMILQKEADFSKKRQEGKSLSQNANQASRKPSSLGISTERMKIFTNVVQSSINPAPTTPTQKRTSPKIVERQVEEEPSEWGVKRSVKEDVSSMRQSELRHTHQSKYSSQTIQPTTQLQNGKINFMVTSISINYYQKCFGSKFAKVYVPNRHYYQTSHSTNASSFFWKCSGFLFSRLQEHQDLYLQLINSDGNEQHMVGRVILNASEFKLQGEQAVVRAYLVLESKIVGEVVIGYQVLGKNRQVDAEAKRQTVSLEHLKLNHSKKQATPIKRSKRKKHRDKSLNDSLTNFLRKNRKDKINRYIVNQYSRAHIDSRIVPSPPRKYTPGKSIVIGRGVRFPFSVEEEYKIAVPGPGAYNERSEFERYE